MRSGLAVLMCAVALLVAAPASADAVVNAIVRNAAKQPVDGEVSLSPTGEGKRFRCTTSKGACTIRGVPGGRYIVTFRPKAGSPTAPRKVVIPPSGNTDLHIAAK